MNITRIIILSTAAAVTAAAVTASAAIEPGAPIDYSTLAFYPKRWKDQGHSTELIPWKGKAITFLTISDAHDGEVMEAFIGHLDAGWNLYADLTGRQPTPHRLLDGQPTIAAVPGGLTCGYGCGYVGATGIEMTNFYGVQYPELQKDSKAVPHAYFYEMGRNYYTFGGRHNCFTTGYAVFMRYVCMDTLKLTDNDRRTRKTIDEAIGLYTAMDDLSFLKAFTNVDGLSEKQNRLKTSPSDQPVMYASAMLQLWKKHGDDWLKRFYRQLANCPEASSQSKDGARTQCLAWYLSASCAARKDLAPTFVDQWRLPLSKEAREFLEKTDWKAADLNAGELLKALPKKD